MRKRISLLILSLAMVCSLMGCGASASYESAAPQSPAMGITSDSVGMTNGFFSDSKSEAAMDMEIYEEAAPEMEETVVESTEDGSPTSSTEDYLASQKLIYTCDVDLQTLEFQNTMDALDALIEKYDGFVESESVSDNDHGWYYSDYQKNNGTLEAYVTMRIPTQNYEEFLSEVEGQGKLMNKSERVTNITKSYNDTSTTIEVLEKEEDMLLDMMNRAETIEDMIHVEERLSNVQRQLAIYRSNLYGMDIDIAYSTINVSVQEVMEYTYKPIETTFLQRIWDACKDSVDEFLDACEDLLIFVIYVFPYAIIVLVIVLIVLVKKSKKKIKTIAETSQLDMSELTKEPLEEVKTNQECEPIVQKTDEE